MNAALERLALALIDRCEDVDAAYTRWDSVRSKDNLKWFEQQLTELRVAKFALRSLMQECDDG